MKKRFWKCMVSAVLCMVLVIGCVVPASATSRGTSDTRIYVNGTMISVNTFSDGTRAFSGELGVSAYDPNHVYGGTKVYGAAIEGQECFKPGTSNIFSLHAPSSDYILSLRIELLDSNWAVARSISVQYDIANNELTVVEPTSRTIVVDQIEITAEDFSYQDDRFLTNIMVDASRNPTYEPYYIEAEFSPDVDSQGGMVRPGGPVATFCLSGNVGNTNQITYRFTLYDYNYQSPVQIYATYDILKNDFVFPPV